MSYLTHDFDSSIQGDSEQTRQHVWFIKARQDQAKRDFITDKKEEVTAGLGMEAVVASEFQLREFNLKLDTYEVATTEALMRNQKQIDVVQAKLDVMLAQAYVLPDGRRVFKTKDGAQVFDEHGIEVSEDELDFDLISNDNLSWEDFQHTTSQETILLNEREGLISYQGRLDNARDRIGESEISAEELDALNAELDHFMPSSVREVVPGMEDTVLPNMTAEFSRRSEMSDIVSNKLDDVIPPPTLMQ